MTRLRAAAHANLLTAYRDATYEIFADGQLIPLTIGGPLPPECRPPASGCVHALLTACNPGSIRLADEDNAQRMQRLHDRLSNLAIEWSPALGCSPDGPWLEPSCWLTDVDVERVDALAAEFEQNASVLVDDRGHVVLRVHRDGLRDLAGDDAGMRQPEPCDS
jgi:hypothetical protein